MTQTEQHNVPALRFPGFEEAWKKHKLGELGSFKSGVGFPEAEQGGTTGVPFYKVSDMNLPGNEAVMTTANNCVTEEQVARLKLKPIKTRAVIFAKVGAAIFLERKRQAENFLLDNNMMAFIPGKDVGKEYLNHLFSVLRLSKFAQVGALPSYNGSDLATINLSLPTLPEQHKIAGFLGAVDERIAQVTRKKALLEDYKKGCMQQLFSQSIRFKDDQGNDFPNWEEKRLGEVLTIGSGKDYKHLEAGEIPVYGTGGLMTHVDEYLYDGESVCIGRKGTIDKPALVEGKFWTVDTLFYTHSFKNALPRFIYAVFQQINWQVHNEASGVPSLSKSTIERLKITLPHPDEQQKIADFLSAIDTKIDLVAQELEQAKTFKKGLLQQMFV